jgi:hypothetical protein
VEGEFSSRERWESLHCHHFTSFVKLPVASVDLNDVSKLFVIGYESIKTVLYVGIVVFW